MEYALKYQQYLKGLIISNMMSSIPAYNEYANTVLMPAMDQKVLAEVKALEARRLQQSTIYGIAAADALRGARPPDAARSVAQLGESRSSTSTRPLSDDAGTERAGRQRQAPQPGPEQGLWKDHGADPGDRRRARHHGPQTHGGDGAGQLPKGRLLLCPNGSHLSQFDDQETWFRGVIEFLKQPPDVRGEPRRETGDEPLSPRLTSHVLRLTLSPCLAPRTPGHRANGDRDDPRRRRNESFSSALDLDRTDINSLSLLSLPIPRTHSCAGLARQVSRA